MKRRFFCVLFSVLFVFLAIPFSAYAGLVPERVEYDTSDVREDLTKLLPKEELDALILDETMKTDDGSQYVSLIRVQEYGFDQKKEIWNYYGLYAYVYNPSGKPLTNTSKNSVGLQVKFANDEYSDVMKCSLALLDHSEDHVLYKYEIRMNQFSLVLQAMNAVRREYRISGLELQFEGMTSPKEYDVSSTFWFEGFDAGFNKYRDQNDQTLKSKYERFETIPIELHPTSWLSDTSDKGEGWKYEISGVYFAIPNYYLKKYGNWDGDEDLRGLYAVKGSYNEYKLNGIVTDSQEAYDAASSVAPFLGLYAQGYSEYVPFSFHSDCFDQNASANIYLLYPNYGFNVNPDSKGGFLNSVVANVHCSKTLHALGSAFKSSSDGVSASEILDFFEKNKNVCMNVSSKLRADEDRKLGFNPYEITAGEKPMQFTRYDYSQKHPFLGWLSGSTYDEIANVEWLQRVDPSFFESFGTELDAIEETAIANKYYVGVDQADALVKYATSEKILTAVTSEVKGSTVYLMHFAKTDYVTDPIVCFDGSNVVTSKPYGGNHYYFERTIFDDFDILEFTFKDEEDKMTKVPVICSPVDITGDLPAANNPGGNPSMGTGGSGKGGNELSLWDSLKDWAKVLMIVGGLLVAAFLFSLAAPILGPLFSWIFGIFGKIFGGITKGVSSIFSAREKSYDRKRKREVDRQRDEDHEYDRSRKKIEDEQKDGDRTSSWDLKAREEQRRSEAHALDMKLKKRVDKRQANAAKRKDAEEARRAEDHEHRQRNSNGSGGSFDTDETYQAALARSFRETGVKPAPAKKGKKK